MREPDLGAMLADHDAAVLIGDDALFATPPPGAQVIDLGEAWTETHDGLPFVYAFWAVRPGVMDRRDYRQLHAARAWGRAHMRQIAEEYSFRGQRDPELCHRYLTESIRYRLGNQQLAGLNEFYRRAHRQGLIPRVPTLRFLPLTAGSGCARAARKETA